MNLTKSGMREILFRGKSVDNGEWVEGYIIYNRSRKKYYILTDVTAFPIEVIPETVGQYTEQKSYDKDRIFEGDILKEVGEDNIGVVEYDEAQYMLNIDNTVFNFGYINSEWYEVIGNIHDNPELLKEQE